MDKKENPFKEKIKIAMVKKGLNQTQMAKKLGITNQAFSKWLTDCPNPKLETLNRVAKILEVTGAYFLEGYGLDEEKTPFIIREPSKDYEISLLKKEIEIIKKDIEIIKLQLKK